MNGPFIISLCKIIYFAGVTLTPEANEVNYTEISMMIHE